jgi:hypothetical protein
MVGSAIPAETVRLPPELASCSQARRFVVDRVHRWNRDHLIDSAALCATELATNAVLHSREPFILTIRTAGDGVRIEVLDRAPEHLPITTPSEGSAVDLTSWGSSGRGMQIVASLALRWGVFATEEAKTIWVEVRDEPADAPTAPMLSVLDQRPAGTGLLTLRFLDLPVRAAVSSGIQTEEVIREIQLDQGSTARRPASEFAHFFALVDRTAPVRLAGRHAALQAAAEGRDRFELELETSLDALRSLPELARALAAFEAERALPLPVLTPDVVEFRAWLGVETSRQVAGDPPLSCSL